VGGKKEPKYEATTIENKKEAKPNAIADFILYQERRQKFKNTNKRIKWK